MYDVKSSAEYRSVNEIIDMINHGEIKLDQKNGRWELNKQNKLINSILSGIPIPPIYLFDIGDDQYEVIDGNKRLQAFCDYVSSEEFEKLKADKKRKVRRTGINLISLCLFEGNDIEFKKEVYKRFNQ